MEEAQIETVNYHFALVSVLKSLFLWKPNFHIQFIQIALGSE